MKRILAAIVFAIVTLGAGAQTQDPLKKVYDESLNQMEQIDNALAKAQSEGKYVVCQVGGNWCIWCLRFADFVTRDEEIAKLVDDNFVFIHVNYPGRNKTTDTESVMAQTLRRLGNPARFGFPVFVVLNSDGKVLHLQDSSYLEEGKGYSRDKVISFFSRWTPKAVETVQY